WIIATSINAEIKDSKKNLPKALIIGGIIIIAVYLFYYIGVAGGATNQELIEKGATVAFTNIFGGFLGNILNLFIAVSCLGTTNGLMMACCRSIYSLAARGEGPKPEVYSQLDNKTNMPNNSAIFGLMIAAAWFVYFYLSNLAATWSGPFVFDISELPIITIYMMYIPIFVQWMRKEKGENAIKRYVLPVLAVIGSLFMMLACVLSHKMGVLWYMIVFAVIMAAGGYINSKNKK
ncbi:MAG: APC family permease, partial [Clostridia bacterium]|nr:APC family permease [Clostridia bacterium]